MYVVVAVVKVYPLMAQVTVCGMHDQTDAEVNF